MRHERVRAAKEDAGGRDGTDAPWVADLAEDGDLARQVMNIMEQGVIVWGADGRCVLHNSRVYQVLEIGPDDLHVGTLRAEFRARAVERGEMTPQILQETEQLIRANQPYSFDRYLPSGRVVLTHGRPTRGGGTVVTFTDVTEARRAARELARAKAEAEEAQARALLVLEQERARQAEARMLAQLDEWLQSCKSLEELYMIVQRFMARLLPGSKGELYIYSNSRDALDGMCNWNTRDLHPTITADSCWALRRGRSYAYESGGLCFHCDHVTAHHHSVPADEYICVPIVAHGDTVGLLHIRFDTLAEDAARIATHGEFAIRCGEHISMAIANAKLRDELRDQSIRDPLTGLYNRRYFLDAMRREMSIANRRGGHFGLIAFDADKFKTFNDNHGHDAGDMVLRAIGACLREICAGGEIACRFGGEEFAVLVPGAAEAETMAFAERLREAVAGAQVRHLDGLLPRVTISAGVAVYPACGSDPTTLLRRADEALYRAKADGRDCVRAAGCA
jgi:diguanylate cyclase (GGDEF)-like protein